MNRYLNGREHGAGSQHSYSLLRAPRSMLVVTSAEVGQALASVLRMIVQPPLHFRGLQGRVEPLQEAKLLGRPVLDPHVAELILEERREPPERS